jgi:hypothetical protein
MEEVATRTRLRAYPSLSRLDLQRSTGRIDRPPGCEACPLALRDGDALQAMGAAAWASARPDAAGVIADGLLALARGVGVPRGAWACSGG